MNTFICKLRNHPSPRRKEKITFELKHKRTYADKLPFKMRLVNISKMAASFLEPVGATPSSLLCSPSSTTTNPDRRQTETETRLPLLHLTTLFSPSIHPLVLVFPSQETRTSSQQVKCCCVMSRIMTSVPQRRREERAAEDQWWEMFRTACVRVCVCVRKYMEKQHLPAVLRQH